MTEKHAFVSAVEGQLNGWAVGCGICNDVPGREIHFEDGKWIEGGDPLDYLSAKMGLKEGWLVVSTEEEFKLHCLLVHKWRFSGMYDHWEDYEAWVHQDMHDAQHKYGEADHDHDPAL
jgi:hypothetical protein